MEMGDFNGACEDWMKARALGFDIAQYHHLINSYCDSI